MSSDSKPATGLDPIALGTVFGLCSAIGYTAANVFLRASIHCDPIWVSCMKAAPTVFIIGPWLLVRGFRRQVIVPSTRTLSWLLVMGLVGQLGGNVLFQWSLGIIGIALTVPLTLGTMILSGTVLGRKLLCESVSGRMVGSIALLIVAIVVLSFGARAANQSIELAAAEQQVSTLRILAGVMAACASGVAYCSLGVALRSAARQGTPQSTILTAVGTVGLLGLGTLSLARIGISGMLETSADDFGVMLLAGFCNLVAFWTLTKAFEVIGLVYVNALNASQSAMASLAGVVLFHEPLTVAMLVGVGLTVAGLILMRSDRQEVRAASERKAVAVPSVACSAKR